MQSPVDNVRPATKLQYVRSNIGIGLSGSELRIPIDNVKSTATGKVVAYRKAQYRVLSHPRYTPATT